jgi:SAM-dependent methyltransferase
MKADYWETRFSAEGEMWKFEPADSAWIVLELFRKNRLRKILIPGMGYGRNARLFANNGFQVTGIEISQSAISLARANGMNFPVHHGSVVHMPFDNDTYDGIFCYATAHLLNKNERRKFISECYKQLNPGGFMVFTVASDRMSLFGQGKKLSTNRYRIQPGLDVYFYTDAALESEFGPYHIIEYRDIEEPVKFMENQQPVLLKLVICRKTE